MHLFGTLDKEWKLKPKSLTTDYEKGLRNALRLMYPEAQILGCWFHYCQCIRRKALSLGLFTFFKTNGAARRLYRKFLSLPLIHADHLELAFEHLSVEANGFGDVFKTFLDYVQSQWIENEGAKSLSLFLELHRTNNLSESYNLNFNSMDLCLSFSK